MFEVVDNAFATKVNTVLLVIDKTVPITTFPAVFIILPTLICVVNVVPEPVIVADATDVEMVPVRAVLGHALALQFPVATEIMVAAKATDVTRQKIMISAVVRK